MCVLGITWPFAGLTFAFVQQLLPRLKLVAVVLQYLCLHISDVASTACHARLSAAGFLPPLLQRSLDPIPSTMLIAFSDKLTNEYN